MFAGRKGVLDSVLSLAAQEALKARYSETTTGHLLIALSRAAEESESPESLGKVQELKCEFELLGIDSRTFRRRLRALLGTRNGRVIGSSIHRSARCKAVFTAAQRSAAEERVPIGPVHLLRAALASLADDSSGSNDRGEAIPVGAADDIPAEL